MKKIITFLFFVGITLIPTVSFGQGSCPIIVHADLTANGDGNWTFYIEWDNPTSGAKSIHLKIGGTIIDQCIDATIDGHMTFSSIASASKPSVVYDVHTGGSTCLGTICGTSLPLVLTSFTAQKENQTVNLSWSVVKEMVEEGESFSIERSPDATNFTSVATMSASSNQSNYSYTDNPGASKVFYRLALNNNAGKKYSNIVAVVTDAAGAKIEVPQNTGIVRFIMLKGTEATVINSSGQSVQTFRVNNDFVSVNLKDLSPGVYFIRCVKDSKIVRAQKFIR